MGLHHLVGRTGEVRDAHMQFKMYMTTGSSDLSNKYLIRAGGGKHFEEKGG